MKLVKLKCEGCGATLKVNDELKKISCNYCGTEFLVDDGTTTHIYREIDEAKIKESEIKDKINERKLKYKEREDKRTYLILFIWFGFLILLIVAGILQITPGKNEVAMPVAAETFKGENYKQVMRELEDMGFENIDSEKLEDLITGWVTKEGDVEKVSINGDTEFEKGDIFPKDASIVVTYHTFENK